MLPAAETEFSGHVVQLAGPGPSLYVPTGHGEHVPPFAPECPGLHWHVVPAAETEFAGHDMQVAGPSPALYVPTGHGEHVPPFGPVYPALQTQAVMPVLPAGEFEFAAQSEHVYACSY